MYGKQLDRVAKRVRELDDAVDRLKSDRRRLEEYLQEEFIDFVTRNTDAKFAEIEPLGKGSGAHSVTVYLTASIKISLSTWGDPSAEIYKNKGVLGYYDARNGIVMSHKAVDPVPEYIKDKVRRLFQDVLPAWRQAVDTLDVEALMTTRVLRWIAKELPDCWADVIEGHLVDKI
jgi:hypothetical protein